MKKNVLLIQSLLVLPLTCSSSLLSMMESTKKDFNTMTFEEMATFIQEEDDFKISINSLLFSDEETHFTAYPTKYTEEETITLSLPTPKQNVTHTEINALETSVARLEAEVEELAIENTINAKYKVLEQLLNGTVTLKKKTLLTVPVKHQKKFKQIKHALTSDRALLKTPEIITVDTVAEREYWVENHNKFQSVLNELLTTEKNLKTPTIYPTNTNTLTLLTESIMITPTPSKKGLDDLPYLYQYGRYQPYQLIQYLFTNTETDSNKKAQYRFDLNNETHLELLEQTFNHYIDQKDTPAIITLLEKCQCTAGELQINTRVAVKLHNYLEKITKEEEEESKLILAKKSTQFIARSNALIIALQEEFTKRTQQLHEEFNTYQTDCNDTFSKKADYMRKLKKTTIATHVLSPDLKLTKSECSDTIDHLRSKTTKTKIYMTQEDVNAVCSNERLLKKIELSEPMATLQNNTQYLLEHISAINRSTQGVTLLTQ